MTPKSLFIIITKIIRLLLLLDVLNIFPKFMDRLDTVMHIGGFELIIYQLSFTVAIFLIYFLILRQLLFKSEKVVEKLELDKGFKEKKFELNIHRSHLIKICIIIIGGVIFIQSFVPFILNIYLFIQSKYDFFGTALFSTSGFNPLNLARDIIMGLVAYYLLTNYNGIANWVELKRRETPTENPENNEET